MKSVGGKGVEFVHAPGVCQEFGVTQISAERQTNIDQAGARPVVQPRVLALMTSRVAAGHVMLAMSFVLVGTVIAFVRFRVSPWYPPMNDVNSDVYVFQMVGNSWNAGYLPYRDVYDVKGPFLYLLFGLFAWLAPWSMTPPLVLLAVLATAAVGLSYVIAQRFGLSRGTAAAAAVASTVVAYLGVSGVSTSFTCEEVAVPGVLLMLGLVLRLLGSERAEPAKTAHPAAALEDRVPAGWWVVNGAAFGALFWAKYQVISPWALMFLGLVVLTVRGRISLRSLGRVAAWNALGLVIATAAILPWYRSVLPEMVEAYFAGKRGSIDLSGELPAQAAWFMKTVTENTGAALVLAGVLVVFVVATVATRSPRWAVLTLALALTIEASAAFVRHPNNLFVPLSFSIVALSWLLSTPRTAAWPRKLVTAAVLVTAGLLVAGPLAEASATMRLFAQPKDLTCKDVATGTVTRERAQVSTVFADAADHQPILSMATLFAARTSFISRQPMRHPYEFVDRSWAWTIGATQVQTRYLQDRTFTYVWVHVDNLQKSTDLSRTLTKVGATKAYLRPEQATVLIDDYEPVLACGNELLLRAAPK